MENNNQMKERYLLWERVFEDTKQYMDYYFSNKARRSQCVEDREGETLCSMAFFTPYSVVYQGEKMTLPYIVGVATDEKFRHQGRMTKVLVAGMEQQKKENKPLVFLSPANTEIYRPLGFETVYWRDTLKLFGKGKFTCSVLRWDELEPDKKSEVSRFVEGVLEKESFDLRMVHDISYYEEVHKELISLNGAVLTFWEGAMPVAVAHWICEEGKHEVTEWIGAQEWREQSVQALLAYVGGDVTIEDTYFLEGMEIAEGSFERKKHPYLMVRMLDETKSVPKRCYINDIT